MLNIYPLCRMLLLPILILTVGSLPAQTPSAYAGPDMDFCGGDTVQLQGSGTNAGPNYTYQWSPSTYLSDPTLANPLAWPPTDIAYTLVVTSNSLVSAPDTVELRVHPIPTVNAGPDQAICVTDSAFLDGTATGDPSNVYTFVWSPNDWLSDSTAEDPVATPLQSTLYYFSAVSVWGCASGTDSSFVTVLPTPFAEAGPNDIVCIGDSILLTASYSWATPNTLPASQVSARWSPASQVQSPDSFATVLLVDSTRWYTVEVAAGQCSTTDSVYIAAIPRPAVTLSQNGNTLTTNGGLAGALIQWYKDEQVIPGASNFSFTVGQPGCYAALMIEGGCSSLSDTICFTTVGFREFEGRSRVEAFPNPFKEEIYLEIDLLNGEELGFELRNVLGQKVLSIPPRPFSPGLHRLSIPTGILPEGVYMLQMLGQNERVSFPLLH